MSNGSSVTLLKPKIGGLRLLAMAVGGILGPWMIQLPFWFSFSGPSVVIGFILGAILLTPIIMAYGELTSMLPFAAGEYIFVRRGLGRQAGFFTGWTLIWLYVIVCAFMGPATVRMFEALAGLELSTGTVILWALAVLAVIALLNYFNIIVSFTAQLIMTGVLVVIGVVMALLFFSHSDFDLGNFSPFFTSGIVGFLRAMAIAMTMYVGFDIIPQMAEESSVPRKRLFWVMFGSVAITGVFYIMVSLANAGMRPTSWILEQTVSDSTIASEAYGRWLEVLILVAAIATIVTSLNAFFIATSRVIFGLARARVLPPALSRVNRYDVPDLAILVTFVLAGLVIGLGGENWLNITITTATVTAGIVYGLCCVSVLALRSSHPEWPRPYRTPFVGFVGIGGAIIALGMAIFGGSSVVRTGWIMLVVFFVVGVAVYFYMETRGRADANYVEIVLSPGDADVVA